MYPQYDEVKATEAGAYLLHLAKNRKKHKWLLKMLYLIERESFEQFERPMFYDQLISMEKGQNLSITYDIIKESYSYYGKYWRQIIRKDIMWCMHLIDGLPEFKRLSEDDKELINKVFSEFGHMSADELGDYTHGLPEYKDPGKSSLPTSYEELLDAFGYDKKERIRILGELHEEAILDSLLGN